MSQLLDLAPQSLTQIERNLIEVVDSRLRMRGLAREILDVRNQGDRADLLSWLLRDKGLDAAAEYVDDWPLLYREGVMWLSERGTLAAQYRAFHWLGWDEAKIEEVLQGGRLWALSQIDLGRAPALLDDLARIIGLSRLSAPARRVLTRIHGGVDHQALRLDAHELDQSLLDFDSGVRLRSDWPILSFRQFNTDMCDSAESHFANGLCLYRKDVGSGLYVADVILDFSVPDNQLRAYSTPTNIGIVLPDLVTSHIDGSDLFEDPRIVKAGLRLDEAWGLENSPNSVFPFYRLIPYGAHWRADQIELDAQASWNEAEQIEELFSSDWRDEIIYGPIELLHQTTVLVRTATFLAHGFALDASSCDHTPMEQIVSRAIQLGSTLFFASEYDGQNWIDLTVPPSGQWKDLNVILGETHVDSL